MSSQFFKIWSRKFLLLGGLALGLSQVGCAHPLVVQPSVAVSSRIGHFPVYAQVGIPGPVVMVPPPRVIYAPPPRVIYAPPVYYRAAPAWGYGPSPRSAWGHDRPGRKDHRDDRHHDRGYDHPGEGRGPAGRAERDGWRR
jgi:hypothetical protein